MSDGNIIFIDAHFIFKEGRKTRDGCTNSSFSVNLYSLSSKAEKIIHNWMKHFLGIPQRTRLPKRVFCRWVTCTAMDNNGNNAHDVKLGTGLKYIHSFIFSSFHSG